MKNFLVFGLVAVFWTMALTVASGDVVKMKDGRTFVGLIVSEKTRTVSIDTRISTIRTTVTLNRREISSIERKKLPVGFFDTPNRPTAPRAKPDDPGRLTPVNRPTKPRSRRRTASQGLRYIEIPIKGVFGQDIIPIGVENALKQAKRRGVEHIVFHIDSDGGQVWAASDIAAILDAYEEEFTYHALIDKAVSAAIWVALSCDTLDMIPGASMGAAVVFTKDASTGAAEVDAKMNSAIGARLAARAEKHGHDPVLVRAMVIAQAEAYAWKDEDDQWIIDSQRPKLSNIESLRTLDDRQTVLTLTASEADELGFASLYEDGSAQELALALGLEAWSSGGLYGAREMELAKKRAKPIFDRFDRLAKKINVSIQAAQQADPGNYQYYVDYGGNFTDGSRRQWQRHTDEAIRQWTQTQDALIEIEKLERDRKRLGMSRWVETLDIKGLFEQMSENVRRLSEARDQR